MRFSKNSGVVVCALAATISLGNSSSAFALELFGKCLFGKCEKTFDGDNLIDPRHYDLEFVVSGEESERVKANLEGSSGLWLNREKAVGGSSGLINRAKQDYRRILGGLYKEGLYAGSVSIEINGSQVANISSGDELPKRSTVVVKVATGATYRFGKADVINGAPHVDNIPDYVKRGEAVGFARGLIAGADAVRKAAEAERQAWRQQGYAKAKVESRSATAVHPSRQLNVAIRMVSGPKAIFGELGVEGHDNMDPEFISYMTGIEAGDEFDPDELAAARKRLDRLGVFSSRRLEEAKSIKGDGTLPIQVVVSERKLRRVGAGATASSLDGAGLEAYWLHRNMFGKAERLRFDGKVGGLGRTFNPDRLDYLLSSTLTQPGIFTPDTDLTWNVFAKREFNETFAETSTGGSFKLTNFFSRELTFSGGGFVEYGQSEDIFGKRRTFTTGVEGEVIYDGRDNRLDATRGIYASLAARPFHEWRSSESAVHLLTEARTYLSLNDKGKTVLAGRVKAGTLLGAPSQNTPANLLFTAGGGNSLRGYAFKSVGVNNSAGQLGGGRSLFETSVEIRHKFNEKFGVVAFADAATVGGDSLIKFSEPLNYGVGLGIRYYTALGPIRLDVAIPLNPKSGADKFGIYAGIGQAF